MAEPAQRHLSIGPSFWGWPGRRCKDRPTGIGSHLAKPTRAASSRDGKPPGASADRGRASTKRILQKAAASYRGFGAGRRFARFEIGFRHSQSGITLIDSAFCQVVPMKRGGPEAAPLGLFDLKSDQVPRIAVGTAHQCAGFRIIQDHFIRRIPFDLPPD